MVGKKAVVIGSVNYDVCLKQKRLPVEGETYFGDSVTYCSGGKGGNQAVQAAKLGVPTYMVGCIGDDASGQFLKSTLEQYGVHTDYLRTVPGNSGMSVAQSLEDGGVRATVVRGANDQVTRADVDALADFLQPGDIAVFQLEIPIPVVEYAIDLCKKKGCFVILNGAPASALPRETLAQTDLFIVNEVEAGFYCGQEIQSPETAGPLADQMARELGNICIFTLGKAGSVVSDGTRQAFVPARKVQAVESTGAGDSFIGGLCYALTAGMDIFEATRFATCCSARTVCGIGGQPSMPTLPEVEQLYRQPQTSAS